jgi:hypothetical protein
MWQNNFIFGLFMLGITALLHRGAIVFFSREGIALWDQDEKKSLTDNLLEFVASVILSLTASAALGLLLAGLLGLFGFPINVP